MTDRMIVAPWAPEQVEALNVYQCSGRMHPFTCARDHDGPAVVLIARADGWHCSDPACDYRQDWAHAFMAEQPPAPICGEQCGEQPETVCTEPPLHRLPHGGPLIIDGSWCGGAAWGPDDGYADAPQNLGAHSDIGAGRVKQAMAEQTTQTGALAQLLATAVRDAACAGDCGQTEEECAQQRIQPVVWHFGALAEVSGTPEQFAAAILPVMSAGPAETIARLRMDLEQAREQLACGEERHQRELAAIGAERDGLGEAMNNLLAIDKPSAAFARVQAFADQLDGFAEDALTVPDRKLYASLADSLRTAIQGPKDSEAGR